MMGSTIYPTIGVKENYHPINDVFVKTNEVNFGYMNYSEAYYKAIKNNVDLWVYKGYNINEAEKYAKQASKQGKMYAIADENESGLRPGLNKLCFMNGSLYFEDQNSIVWKNYYKQIENSKMYQYQYQYSAPYFGGFSGGICSGGG
jgi:hypothetical protein